MCRTRRIKVRYRPGGRLPFLALATVYSHLKQCDETKPTCNQCAKSHRQCPGYKDEFDLIFRNETRATERRAKRASKKAMSASHKIGIQGQEPISPVSSEGSLSPTIKDAIKSPLEMAIIPAIEVPLDTKASCHFVSNFVLIPHQGSTRGFMDYLIPLLRTESLDSHLQHAFNACALASLGNRVMSDGVKFQERAYAEYTKALAGTNAALRHPEASKSDGTLAAVLMLGMFENITAKQMGDFAWGSHVEGAIQIVRARGRKQLRTKTGLLLFVAVRTQLVSPLALRLPPLLLTIGPLRK